MRPNLVQVEVVNEPELGAGVERHVRQHMDTSSFGQRAQDLGQVNEAVEEFQEHVSQTFDHSVGRLAAKAGASVPAPARDSSATAVVHAPGTAAAAGLAAILASGATLRQAIIFHEIFSRPEDRW